MMTNSSLDLGHEDTSAARKDYLTDALMSCSWRWNGGIGEYSEGLVGFGKFYWAWLPLEQMQKSAVQQFLDLLPSGRVVLHSKAC